MPAQPVNQRDRALNAQPPKGAATGKICVLAAAGLVGLLMTDRTAAAGGRANDRGTVPSLASMERDPLLCEALHARHAKDVISATGAMGANILFEKGESTKWFIEDQRTGADEVVAGVLLGKPEFVATGLRAFEWGWRRQGSDGGFPGTCDPFHSVSFFVEAAARAMLVMKQSGRPEYMPVIASRIGHLRAAARWLLHPVPKQLEKEQPFTHRKYILAAALGMTAALTGDKDLDAAARQYAREGIARQAPEGYNPEKGGFDIGYQVVGLVFAARYDTVCPEADLRSRLAAMLQRGLEWQIQRIDTVGEIHPEGSTRIGSEKNRVGKTKSINYGGTIQALVYGAHILNNASYLPIARTVAAGRNWIKH